MDTTTLGISIQRKEAWDKVTGRAKYNGDSISSDMLYVKMLTSPLAHGNIKSIDTSKALTASGVQAIILGRDINMTCGPIIEDRPPIAIDKVRYHGEPVALVVANSEHEAMQAAKMIQVEYESLPVVNSVSQALESGAPLIHENLSQYTKATKYAYPEAGTNISHRVKIRKGDMARGWGESEVIIEEVFKLPQSDHIATETRNVQAQILPDGKVVINTSSQAPFTVKQDISKYFNVSQGNIIVKVPLVGGGFGGKAPVQLEILAYIGSSAVGGRLVKIANTREEDIITSPCKLGLEAKVKIGASKDGTIKAMEMTFMLDCGAYSDIGPRLAKAIAVDCTGPYNVENLWCDSLCVYTNHPFATSFRGFGHESYTFCTERALDKLSLSLGMNPLDLRLKNTISTGKTTPTQVKVTPSNVGDVAQCILKVKELINWEEGLRIDIGGNKIRAKGMSCLWKTSNSPTDAVSGAILTFNEDGSINLNCGAVEFGPGMKTTAAQILAEKMKMDINRIHVFMDVDTQVSPKHWKTVASMTTYMVGRSVLQAAEDLCRQLINISANVMMVPPEDLDIENEKVFLKHDPDRYLDFKDICHGFKYPEGNAVGGQIIGKGTFIMSHLTPLNKETGAGKPGPAWTVGAQAVEVEYDTKEFTYRLLKAVTVIDAGKLINPNTARGLITGGMSMGFGLATREGFVYSDEGIVKNTSLRTYKVMHYGQVPEYIVDFIECPQVDAPYGARGFAEHGIIGIPAALANALSSAAQVDLNQIPITPETIWMAKTGGLI